jgi:hypothetical protein
LDQKQTPWHGLLHVNDIAKAMLHVYVYVFVSGGKYVIYWSAVFNSIQISPVCFLAWRPQVADSAWVM